MRISDWSSDVCSSDLTASLVADGAVTVNPAEAFVLGASILLHDAAMSLGAYPNGLADVRKTVAWQDAAARLSLADEENGGEGFDVTAPPKEIEDRQIGRASCRERVCQDG